MGLLNDGSDNIRYKAFTRRTLLLSGGTLGIFTIIGGRLYNLQVLERERFAVLAEDNRVNQQLLPPLRGRIFDRFGVELASNRQNYRVILIPEQTDSVERALDAIAHYVPLTERQRQKALREAKRNRPFVPITVAENLTWEQFATLNLQMPELEGLQPDVGDTRDYPFGGRLSHVLGYVAAVSERDMEGSDDPLLQLPGFRIGKNGVERAEDERLRGTRGLRQIEVDAYGRIIRELGREEGVQGDDVVMTLDMEIQKFATDRLTDQSASCVVMDVHTGDIVAFVSNPGFDPNEFNNGISQENYQKLLDDPYLPLLNKALAGQYPPGSTFKMLVAIAAVENNVISPEQTVFCGGATNLGSHTFHCWKRGGHGAMNMVLGIKNSCDVYFYELARRVGIDGIAAMSHRFGLGETFGFEVPGEKSGLVPSREWKLARFGEEWQQGETLITGIGQGYMLTTPLQLATMTARIANGGRKVMPHIIRSIGPRMRERPEPEPMGISERAIQLVHAGMNAVVNEGGTAAGSRIADTSFTMAGKTGSAQVRRISREERATGVRRNEDLPWALRDHALFVAFAPVEAPRYAMSVVVEHGGSGSRAAAPIARDIMELTLKRDPARRAAIAPLQNGAPPPPPPQDI